MSYYGGPTKEEMFNLLVMKTRELGRLVTFEEADADERLPKANNYSWHWGEYSKAAEAAWNHVKYHEADGEEPKGVVVLAKKGFKRLDPDREKTVMNELAEMYIKEGGKLPSSRSIKKNRYIKEEEVESIKRAGLFTEHRLEQIAVANFGYTPKPKPEVVQPDPVAQNEPKLESEVAVNEEIPVEPEEEQEVETMEETKSRTAMRYTPEECEEMLLAACTKAGHILSRVEVEELARKGEVPGWVTLTKKIGPWYEWKERYGLDWKSDRIAQMAEDAKKEAEQGESEPESNKPVVVAEEPADDSTDALEVVPEEMVEDESGDESDTGDEHDDEYADESSEDDSEEYYEENGESYENGIVIPIKIVLPEGVEGTVSDIHGSITITHLKIDF